MYEVTLGELRSQAKDRADMVNSSFISDTNWDNYLNREASELYDLLVGSFEDYFVKTGNLRLVATQESYDLPSDFYKMAKVFWKGPNNRRWRLRRFAMEEMDYYDEYYSPLGTYSRYLRYRILGPKIYFMPDPVEAGDVELFYIPQFVPMKNENQKLSFNIPAMGWDDVIIAGAAARALKKEESDPSMLLMEKAQAIENVKNSASDRDAGEPAHVADVEDRFGFRYGWR